MARAKQSVDSRGVRRALAGSALLLAGASVGLLLGSVLEGPRLMVRRWTQQVSTLELTAPAEWTAQLPRMERVAQGFTPPG